MRVSLMSMLSITAVVLGALHGKLSHDANVAAGLDDEPRLTRPGGRDQPKPGDTTNDDTKTGGPGTAAGAIKADYEDISADLARAESLLRPETFDEAERLLTELLERDAAPSSLEKARTLRGEVRLLRALTIIIPRHSFASGDDLEVVTLADGKDHLARVEDAGKEEITVKLQDGRSLRMRKARLRGRTPLAGAAFRERLERELKLRTEALGAEANPVEIYRTVVTWCLEFGLEDPAIKHLRAALRKPSAGVLVDLFCEGDVQVHRRTQAALAGLDQLAMLDRRRSFSRIRRAARTPGSTTDDETGSTTGGASSTTDGRPSDKRPTTGGSEGRPTTGGTEQGGDATTEPDAGPIDEPAPVPEDPRPKPRIDRTADLQKEAKWVKADKLYQQGIRLYRTSFSGSANQNFETVKRSRQFFEQAQMLLIELSETPEWEDDATLEQRAVEIQQLIYDCIKRGKV